MNCERCNETIIDESYAWPGSIRGAFLCQGCWEAYCSETWWEAMRVLNEWYGDTAVSGYSTIFGHDDYASDPYRREGTVAA